MKTERLIWYHLQIAAIEVKRDRLKAFNVECKAKKEKILSHELGEVEILYTHLLDRFNEELKKDAISEMQSDIEKSRLKMKPELTVNDMRKRFHGGYNVDTICDNCGKRQRYVIGKGLPITPMISGGICKRCGCKTLRKFA